MKFYFDVRGDKIVAREDYSFVEGNENTYEAVFTFDEAWNPDMARQCICEVKGKRYVMPITSGSCLLPEMVKGSSYIGVIGVITDYDLVARISTNMITFGVSRGAYNGEVGEEFKSAAEVWEIYLSDMEKSRQAAETAAGRAKEQADRIKNLDVSAEEGIQAAVTKTETKDGISLKFTLPKGEKGDEGPKGDTGERGPQGIQGPKGDKGDQGDRGPAGVKGADGYTPKKGIDYFTPEDIEALGIPDKEQVEMLARENAEIYPKVFRNEESIKELYNSKNSIQYYGDTNIVPSDASLFVFTTDDATMTAQVAAKSTDIRGDIVIPYEYVDGEKKYKVVNVGNRGFHDCTNITKITLPKGVGLGGACFLNSRITSFLIPDGIAEVPVNTFYNSLIVEVILPKSVERINAGCFQNCTSLTDVYYRGTKSQWDAITITEGNDALLNATIHYEWSDVTKGYVDEKIGDIDNALKELHNYAQALIGGAE